jgi:hypothetical protein
MIPPEGTVFIAGVPLPPNAVRLATRLLAVFGESVEMTVAMRIDELADAGDEEGARRWRAVLAAMDKIRRAPAPGERRH